MSEPASEKERDSIDAMLDQARFLELVDCNELAAIPELLSLFSQTTEPLFQFVHLAMDLAMEKEDPSSRMKAMEDTCMYLFAKGVEAVMLWRDTSDGTIPIKFDIQHLTDYDDVQTNLDEERHLIVSECMAYGCALYNAHYDFVMEVYDSGGIPVDSPEEFMHGEMRKTLEWIPRIAINYAIKRGYHQ